MRYLLILALALAMTIAWQTSVVADNPADALAMQQYGGNQ